MFKQLTLDGTMNDETQDRPRIMDKNMKNYLKIQKNEDNSITNIGNEYYQLKKSIYDLNKNKNVEFNLDRRMLKQQDYEDKKLKAWGGRSIQASENQRSPDGSLRDMELHVGQSKLDFKKKNTDMTKWQNANFNGGIL